MLRSAHLTNKGGKMSNNNVKIGKLGGGGVMRKSRKDSQQFGQPKITIIIPVYNVERYLRQCLDSVVNQTMRDIQIICVNDGSPDGSLTILQEYADRDSRIEIIDKPNGGLSSARNAAYPHIKGKYTLFVDSDDWLELDLCERTYETSETTGAAMSIFFWSGEDGLNTPSRHRYLSPGDKTTAEEKFPFLHYPTAWSKLWRTDFLLDNKLYFPEGLVFEDQFVNWKAVILADKISVIPERLYHYRYNPGSIMQSQEKYWTHIVLVYDKTHDEVIRLGHYEVYRNQFIAHKLNIWHQRYSKLPVSLKPEMMRMIRGSLRADDREFYRTAPKTSVPKRVRLFYEMIDGGVMETVRYQLSHTTEEIIKLPERVLRNWIIKPIKKLGSSFHSGFCSRGTG
ncbi:MAG: glycosyltransferase [Planctomycetaceae bacterium]|jgi:glycosyltransferase involved in cell wall biosynthesis|nr:glycosyltransferase [Planctomycetaceae bacterium]